MTKLAFQAFLLGVLLLAVRAGQAADLTWQEANKQSAALIREKGYSKEAADLAVRAFELYEAQSKAYKTEMHAQLLLNAADARQHTNGVSAALLQIEKGAARIEKHLSPGDGILTELWGEAARLSESEGSYKESLHYAKDAAEAAGEAWGTNDPRAIRLFMRWASQARLLDGYFPTRRNFGIAHDRALKSGDEELVFEVEMSLAKLEIENKTYDTARDLYRQLIPRLEKGAEPWKAQFLQVANAQLELCLEKTGDPQGAQALREKRLRLMEEADSELIPLVRVAPRYPRRAAEQRVSGAVVLSLTIGPDGAVTEAGVASSEPPGVFDQAALGVIHQWKFKPKVVDGRAVEQRGVQRIEFRMASPSGNRPRPRRD